MMEEFLLDIGYFKTPDNLWTHKDAEKPLTLEQAYNFEIEQFGVIV